MYAQLRNHFGDEKCPHKKVKLIAHTMRPAQNQTGNETLGLSGAAGISLSGFLNPKSRGNK